eukprot:scaffold1308_cov189-Alexandrium_tamarense.AAC.4
MATDDKHKDDGSDEATLPTAAADEEMGMGRSKSEREENDPVAPLPTFRKRVQVLSDLTGMNLAELAGSRAPRADRLTVSELTVLLNMDPEAVVRQHTRRRQKSSSDVITKFAQANALKGDDLRLAEEVEKYGTITERKELGRTEEASVGSIEQHEGLEPPDDFVYNHVGLTSVQAAALLKEYGPNELPEKIEPKWLIFFRLLFCAPMPIMIWIAVIIEAGIQNWLDMGILLLIQFTNASISFYETNKAGDAVAALKSSLKPSATCKRDGKWEVTDATLLVPGDLVLLGSGSAIPADCRINDSEIDVDQAALTGESLPVTMYKGDSCKMGSTVVRGEVEGTVEFTGANTFFGKTASLLEDTHEISHLQKILMTIMMVLVALSVTLSLIYFVYLLVKGETVKEALSYTVVVLVASIPLAIEIVTTTTLAIGSKELVKEGAIVSRLAAIEDLAGMSILCSDKTGTLTMNKMVLQDDTPTYTDGEDQSSVLVYAAIAAKWKEPPRDALDRLTLGSVDFAKLEHYKQLDYLPFDPQIKRTEGTVEDVRTGEVFKTTKGAPHIILNLLPPEDVAVRDKVEADVAKFGTLGIRSLAVARTDSASGRWRMMGLLTFLDPPREDTKQTIADARDYQVDVKMITGDHLLIARNTARQLEMGDRIFTAERLPLLDEQTKQKPEGLSETYGDLCLVADGFAQVYPEHKYLIVECLREMNYTVGMTGDGVNDAPALKRADVGIAVAGATDAARAAADIVLTQEGLGTIIFGIFIARAIFSRISNFVTYRIAATLQLLIFFFISIFAFHPADYDEAWPEFFHMPVIMLMLITLLNDGTLISIAYDKAEPSRAPSSWNPDGFFQRIGMQGVEYGQVITAIYLKVSISDFLTLFSARTGQKAFWQIRPATTLLVGACLALFLSSILAIFWPNTEIEGIPVEGLRSDMGLFGFVWLYSFVFFLLQDGAKVLVYKWMNKVNFMDISTTGVVVLPESANKLIADLDANLKEEGIPAH